jgi:muskelin
VYSIEDNKWTLITDDTAAMGGPALIFDHQMTLDDENYTLYVFGGRVLTRQEFKSLC